MAKKTVLDNYCEAEMAMLEVMQLTDAARYIIEAQEFIHEAERAATARGARVVPEGVNSPGEISVEQLTGLLYQAWNRAGVARDAMERYHQANRTLRAA